jgi:phenylalanine-4-hydroxylase
VANLSSGIDPRSGVSIPSDYVIFQQPERYSASDHATWRALFERQRRLLEGRVVDAFLDGLAGLGVAADRIPDFDALNRRLTAATGWRLVAVPGLVPDAVFFAHLAARRFPAGYWIRPAQDMDYIEEPDVFHDVFGHAPLLMHPAYADYLQAYGAAGLRLSGGPHLARLARLYWHTVEFGLMRTDAGLRIFGAGVASSATETGWALDDARPRRIRFERVRALRACYDIDRLQELYFVLSGYDDLPALDPVSLDAAMAEAAALGDLAAGVTTPQDCAVAPRNAG